MIHPATMKEHDRRTFTLRTVVRGFNALRSRKWVEIRFMHITVFHGSPPLLSLSCKRRTYDSDSLNHSGFRLGRMCVRTASHTQFLAGDGLIPSAVPAGGTAGILYRISG